MRENFKKCICLGLLLIFTFSLTVQPVSATNNPILKKGMSGENVRKLQKDLKQLGFLTVTPTGYFGDLTEDSVKRFQKRYSIPTTGVVATLTYGKLEALLKKTPPIKVIIDPGHGGVDVGAIRGNAVESEIALGISKKLKTYLENNNYNVALTRATDKALDKFAAKGESLEERDLNGRTSIINKSGAKFFVSIHVNSLPTAPSYNGSVVYYNSKFPQSAVLAQNIQKALNNMMVSNLKRQNHSIQKANYYILRNSNVPGVLVETAFITNATEKKLLMRDDFRSNIAKAIMTGIESSNMK